MSEEKPLSIDSLATPNSRYSRQVRFPGIGSAGQRQIERSSVLLVGCGALGSSIADTLTRAGVGRIHIVDRDVLELSNLQRQTLFNEEDVRSGLPKAVVAQRKLSVINSEVEVTSEVIDVTHENIEELAKDRDLILDGTDNFEVRFLINDCSIKNGIPWVFGGCLGCDGQTMTILPGETPCLRCLMPEGPPAAGTMETCDSFGVLAPIINLIASIQSIEALKILSGNREKTNRKLIVASLWESQLRSLDLSRLLEKQDCPVCHKQEFDWLEGKQESNWAILCGRNAVQLNLPDKKQIDLERLARQLQDLGAIQANPFLLRCQIGEYELTFFPDGRAIVGGTADVVEAKSVYARYVGL